MDYTSRREFLRKAAIGGASVTAGLLHRRIFGQETSGFNRIYYRNLGSTGFKVGEIGMGCMNMRDSELVRAAIDNGINYIDTAHSYMNGVNEQIVGQVMKTQRDKVFLTTKIKWERSGIKPEDMPGMIETSLKRLQTDHVDLLLLHILDRREDVLREEYMKIFDTARKKGQTRYVGLSTHANQDEVLDAAVESKFWEAVLTGYSYYSPKNVTESIRKAREAGIAIIAMKSLISTERPRKQFPDIRRDKSGKTNNQQALLKWVLNNPYVDTTIPGMTSFEQLADDLGVMEMELSFNDQSLLRRYVENTKGRYCCGVAGCAGCRDKCPKGVQVNEINRCLNYVYGYGDLDLAWENYRTLPRSSRVDVCSDCDECVVKCINGLNLTENIKRAKELFV